MLTFTPSQQRALDAFTAFLNGPETSFILTGAAGTGKTTMTKALIDAAQLQERSVQLVAPTARAARVLQQRTGTSAATIHSHIYNVKEVKPGPGLRFLLKPNGVTGKHLLVVDEASMVSSVAPRGELFQSERSVLEDLYHFIRSGEGQTKILFVGDPCQLPPIYDACARALDPALLKPFTGESRLPVHAHLTEVVRQRGDSAVLREATKLRTLIEQHRTDIPHLDLPHSRQWYKSVAEFAERFEQYGHQESVILAYTNNKVFKYNQMVRDALGRTHWLDKDDFLVVDADAHVAGMYLQRGTPLFVERVGSRFQRVADLQFVDVTLRTEQNDTFTTLVLVDLLTQPAPHLTAEVERALVAERMRDNIDLRENGDPRCDPYLSALRLRFGYALTVHKAQGGEWPSVYADLFIPNVTAPSTSIRWCYTALTRSSSEIMLL